MRLRYSFIVLAAAAGLAISSVPASATSVSYQVVFDTSALAGGVFNLDAQLTDGSFDGLGNGNTTVTLSNFDFGGGFASGGNQYDPFAGDASGSVAAGISLTDTDFFNGFLQGFTAGNTLSFTLGLTTSGQINIQDTPDLFTLMLTDGSWLALGPGGDGFGTQLLVDFSTMIPEGFASGSPYDIDAPTITQVNEVPEPTSLLLLGTGALSLLRPRVRRLLKRGNRQQAAA